MKTMIKLAKTKKRLPILQTVIVRNGTAYSTDMDMEISTACSMPEGIYHAEGFGTLNVLTNFPWEDVPERLAVESPMGQIDISCDNLAWVLETVSNEATRYYLNGVFFDGKGAIVSTDGHMLNKLDYNMPVNVAHIVPTQAIKMALALAKEEKRKELTISFYKDRAVFLTGNSMLVTKTIDETFPDYERVIPRESEHVIKWDGMPDSTHKEIKTLAKIEGVKTAAVKCNDMLSAYGKQWPIAQQFPFDIVFNADYLASVMPGAMGLNDPRAPVKVVNADRLTVIMPMRI